METDSVYLMTNPYALLNHMASQECFKIAKGVRHILCLLYAYNNDEDDNFGNSRALFMLDSARGGHKNYSWVSRALLLFGPMGGSQSMLGHGNWYGKRLLSLLPVLAA